MPLRSCGPALWLTLLACAGLGGDEEPAPLGRLPEDLRPLHYALELQVLPDQEDFQGRARIRVRLERPRRTLWLHGRDLAMSVARVEIDGEEPFEAHWEPHGEGGVAALRLPRVLGPGEATLHFEWRARFGRTLRGLYRIRVGEEAYAFTQFEPIAARQAFPGFDEPTFKTPFDVALVVRREDSAIASTPALDEQERPGGLRRVRFATTPKLPTYLLAFAVGPLDVVEVPALPPDGPRRRSLPFRGVATRGRGGELDYALRHTPALLAHQERYFGREYPYAKLDVIAVPDFASGAMENVGAITFREYLLLLDPVQAPEEQRRRFTYVMAHELAHQWFGNLVTMPWWDDLWLNEAFATWLGSRSVEQVRPEQGAELRQLQFVHRAMRVDSLVSARAIRQPIASDHDIRNAFDAITYSKGAGVLGMFERWLGEEVFRDGIRRYVARHAHGSARSEDLLAALSEAAGRDVASPFSRFLDQPGLPFVEAETRCEARGALLRLRQSRYWPLGSEGRPGALWQVPVCARYSVAEQSREACTLLESREGTLALDTKSCPDWVMPNAAAAGYYRFVQPAQDFERLLAAGLDDLSPRERLAVADAFGAALRAGARPAAELYGALPVLARDSERAVATAPMELLGLAHEHLTDVDSRPQVEALARALYGPRFRRLGWQAAPDEDGETRLLRKQLLWFLTEVGRDPVLRREGARRGRLYAGVDAEPEPRWLEPELVESGLSLAVQQGGAPVFDALIEQVFASSDALARGQRLAALGTTEDPQLAARARDLALDPRLRGNERLSTLRPLARRPATRDATWTWVERHFDALVEQLGAERGKAIASLARGFCSEARARSVQAFLGPRIDALIGGPRDLAAAVESIRLCAALVEAQGPSTRTFFAD